MLQVFSNDFLDKLSAIDFYFYQDSQLKYSTIADPPQTCEVFIIRFDLCGNAVRVLDQKNSASATWSERSHKFSWWPIYF